MRTNSLLHLSAELSMTVAVHLLVYDTAMLTSTLSWINPKWLTPSTRSRHSAISVSLSDVWACIRRLIGHAFWRPICGPVHKNQ